MFSKEFNEQISYMLGGISIANFGEEIDQNDLGEGYRLVPVPKEEFPEEELGKYEDKISSKYSYLYKGDRKLTNSIFRKGGQCNGFRDGYCMLIEYDSAIKSGGIHVIVDTKGDIVLESTDSSLSNTYHTKGVIATLDGYYYNLLTGNKIVNNEKSISSDEYLFVENRYDYKEEFKRGVYKISFKTGEYEIFNIDK